MTSSARFGLKQKIQLRESYGNITIYDGTEPSDSLRD